VLDASRFYVEDAAMVRTEEFIVKEDGVFQWILYCGFVEWFFMRAGC
jgi:hypothetical protein